MDHNQIKQIPKSIDKLVKLYKANFSDNNITSLPKDLSNLANLREFSSVNNNIKIDEIPKEIYKMPYLKYFFLVKKWKNASKYQQNLNKSSATNWLKSCS